MAKRKAPARKRTSSSARKRTSKAASKPRLVKRVKSAKTSKARKSRPKAKAKVRTKVRAKPRQAPAKKKKAAATVARRAPKTGAGPSKAPRLERQRRTLEEAGQTPPSSLDMVRRGTAVRTGRAEVAESLREHRGMSPSITGGDVDVNVEDAYFTGDEAPGGDNPTPDQEVVDDIGKALGVEYQDNEELKASEKVTERDRHRWEL